MNGILIEIFEMVTAPIEIYVGLIFIVTGIWTRLTAEDYYIDKEGRRRSLDLDNELFFIKMSIWGLILPLIGVGLLVWELIKELCG